MSPHKAMDNLLVSNQAPTGHTALSWWLAHNAHLMGVRYASEVGRHFKQTPHPAEGTAH